MAFALLIALGLIVAKPMDVSSSTFLRVARVDGNHYVLVDEDNRQRVLRGVNLGVEWWSPHGRPIDPELCTRGHCPKNNNTWNQPPLCEVDAGNGKYNQSSKWNSRNDFAQIRAAGFSVVRLAISWSLLEPRPLEYAPPHKP